MISSSNGTPAGDRAPDVGSAGLQFENVDGHKVAFRAAGQGPALVLLHGFLCDSRCWWPQLTGLSADFSVVAWDAPGADAPPDTVVGRLLPGMFSESAPAELWDEQAAVMSQFHPPGFRVMTQSSADMDTRDLLPAIDVPTLLLWVKTISAVPCTSPSSSAPRSRAPSWR